MFKWAGLGLAIAGAIIGLVAGFAFNNIGWSASGVIVCAIGLFAMAKG